MNILTGNVTEQLQNWIQSLSDVQQRFLSLTFARLDRALNHKRVQYTCDKGNWGPRTGQHTWPIRNIQLYIGHLNFLEVWINVKRTTGNLVEETKNLTNSAIGNKQRWNLIGLHVQLITAKSNTLYSVVKIEQPIFTHSVKIIFRTVKFFTECLWHWP